MDWTQEHIIILGAARQGTALARYLLLQGASVVLTDLRSADLLADVRAELDEFENLKWVLGEHPLSLLDEATLICPSGGVPLTIPFLIEARARGIAFSNDSQIFMQVAPSKVLGITGSAGKTTTTALLGSMAEVAVAEGQFRKVWVGGNIGFPLIAQIDKMTTEDIAVVEFSSFQLDLMTTSPHVGAILNIEPNHLDRHGTMQAYIAAKRNIHAHQSNAEVTVLGADNANAWAEREQAQGQIWAFSRSTLPSGFSGTYLKDENLWLRVGRSDRLIMPQAKIQIRGDHNVLNVLAACAIAAAAGISESAMVTGVTNFKGVPHRLEFVRTLNGANWYNDSKATGPALAIASIHSFNEPLVVLAGGEDKALPWGDFAKVVSERADHVILFGEAANVIAPVLQAHPGRYSLDVHAGLQAAVVHAAALAQPGDVVLLAPGGTSFDEFKDYEERGDCFKEWVNQIAEAHGGGSR